MFYEKFGVRACVRACVCVRMFAVFAQLISGHGTI